MIAQYAELAVRLIKKSSWANNNKLYFNGHAYIIFGCYYDDWRLLEVENTGVNGSCFIIEVE